MACHGPSQGNEKMAGTVVLASQRRRDGEGEGVHTTTVGHAVDSPGDGIHPKMREISDEIGGCPSGAVLKAELERREKIKRVGVYSAEFLRHREAVADHAVSPGGVLKAVESPEPGLGQAVGLVNMKIYRFVGVRDVFG